MASEAPSRIASEAKAIAKDDGLTIKILDRKEMEQLGMGALLGVARGSHEEPKLIILEYNRAKKKDERPFGEGGSPTLSFKVRKQAG